MERIAFLFTEESPRSIYLFDVLKDEYEVLSVNSFDAAKELIDNSFDLLSALIIDHPSNKPYAKELIEYIGEKNSFMFTLPILLLTNYKLIEEDDIYLSELAVGMITEGESKKTVLQRIKNTIKFSNSASFDDFSNMLKALPSLIYLKDKRGRYAFSSQHWHHYSYEGSIRGLSDFDIRKSRQNAEIAYAADMKVVSTGKGTNYIIKEEDDEGIDYLQIIKEPLKNQKGEVTGIIAIVNNVTEEEILRQELRRKSITDQLTGLYNRFYFEELIKEHKSQLTLPLTIISADCDGLKKINDRFGHAAGDKYICFARDAIKEKLPEKSYLFRMGGDEFLAIIPGMNRNDASKLVKAIISNAKNYKTDDFTLKLSAGSYTITKMGISIESALMLSDKAMYKMKKKRRKTK